MELEALPLWLAWRLGLRCGSHALRRGSHALRPTAALATAALAAAALTTSTLATAALAAAALVFGEGARALDLHQGQRGFLHQRGCRRRHGRRRRTRWLAARGLRRRLLVLVLVFKFREASLLRGAEQPYQQPGSVGADAATDTEREYKVGEHRAER